MCATKQANIRACTYEQVEYFPRNQVNQSWNDSNPNKLTEVE